MEESPSPARGGQRGIKHEIIVTAVHHILKNDHALLITLVIKDIGLDFDVLAQHVQAELFHFG